jgi:uncharacterized protein YxjI
MRYCVTRRAVNPLFAVGHRFRITDEAGEVRYRVRDLLRPVVATAALLDADGKQLLLLEHRHLTLGPGFYFLRDGDVVGLVRVQRDLTRDLTRDLSMVGPELQIRAPDDLALVGDLRRHEYYLMREGRILVYVSRRWCLQRRHTYGVDLPPDADEPLLLACVLALSLLFLYE